MNENKNKPQTDKKRSRLSPLGAFVAVLVIVAVASTVILILHNSYGLLQF